MAKKFVYIKLKSTFTEELQTTYDKSIVFIEDTNEIFTHGVFFGIPADYKGKVDSLESAMAALKCFASVSDGTNTAQAPSTTGVLKFTASNGMTVVVGTQGVTLKGTTIAESATNGNITVKGPSGDTEVKVHGLNTAAYQPSSAFATPASVSTVDEKADAAQTASRIHSVLRDKDRIYLIHHGEFEDIFSLNLIKRTINNSYKNICECRISDFKYDAPMTKILTEFFRINNLGDYQKADFAKKVFENTKTQKDLTQEIVDIVYQIKNL